MILPFPRIYLYGGLALALALGAWWLYRSGKEAGKEAQKQESTQETKAQVEEFRKAAEEEYRRIATASEQAIAAAQERTRMSEARESNLVKTLASLSQSRAQSAERVNSLPDTALHSAIVSALGVRDATESPSCFTFREERKILETLTDYPACQKQTQLQTEQIAEIRTQVASLRDEVKAVEQQAQAEKQLRTRYAEFYATAYNLLRQKKRSGKCLFLWKCGKEPTLNIPAPDNLSKTP